MEKQHSQSRIRKKEREGERDEGRKKRKKLQRVPQVNE